MSNYYAVVYSNKSLTHYGVPGMKWGVRKMAEQIGKAARSYSRLAKNTGKYGLIRGTTTWHAQNVNNRLNNFSSERKAKMTIRQKKSYDLSKKYWSERASGKSHRQIKKEKKVKARGFIKRSMDSGRSRSASARLGRAMAFNLINTAKANTKLKALGFDARASYASSALEAAALVGFDELTNKYLYGHF